MQDVESVKQQAGRGNMSKYGACLFHNSTQSCRVAETVVSLQLFTSFGGNPARLAKKFHPCAQRRIFSFSCLVNTASILWCQIKGKLPVVSPCWSHTPDKGCQFSLFLLALNILFFCGRSHTFHSTISVCGLKCSADKRKKPLSWLTSCFLKRCLLL